MNIKELKEALNAHGVRSDAYSINDGGADEAYVLLREQGIWHVFYSERGSRASVQEHISEADACGDLMRRLLADKSTRI